jgi:hypothetical protein
MMVDYGKKLIKALHDYGWEPEGQSQQLVFAQDMTTISAT